MLLAELLPYKPSLHNEWNMRGVDVCGFLFGIDRKKLILVKIYESLLPPPRFDELGIVPLR